MSRGWRQRPRLMRGRTSSSSTRLISVRPSGGSEVSLVHIIINDLQAQCVRTWFAGAASTATHCAVFAQLIVKGKKHGVKTFVVQLRDVK